MSVVDDLEAAGDGISLVVTEADRYVETNMEILDHLVEVRGLPGIYVTINKPYDTIVGILENHGISTDNIFFVDAVSLDAGEETVDNEQVLFMDSPEDLTGLSIVISEGVDSMPEGEKFIFLDSLTTLTVYNRSKTVSQFAHFLTRKMRNWGVAGVILSLEEETDEELIDQISQFCDNVIRRDD